MSTRPPPTHGVRIRVEVIVETWGNATPRSGDAASEWHLQDGDVPKLICRKLVDNAARLACERFNNDS